MIVHQTVSPKVSQNVKDQPMTYSVKPIELPMSAENSLFPLHHLDAFLNFVFQLLLVFIISASIFPAMRWLDTQMQQLTSISPSK
ncbi:MAG: hypothetical protein AB7I41_16765 [Candidatus Sericytochromatia bacterium]